MIRKVINFAVILMTMFCSTFYSTIVYSQEFEIEQFTDAHFPGAPTMKAGAGFSDANDEYVIAAGMTQRYTYPVLPNTGTDVDANLDGNGFYVKKYRKTANNPEQPIWENFYYYRNLSASIHQTDACHYSIPGDPDYRFHPRKIFRHNARFYTGSGFVFQDAYIVVGQVDHVPNALSVDTFDHIFIAVIRTNGDMMGPVPSVGPDGENVYLYHGQAFGQNSPCNSGPDWVNLLQRHLQFTDCIPTSDGGYLISAVAGTQYNAYRDTMESANAEPVLIKVDRDFNMDWFNSYYNSNWDVGERIWKINSIVEGAPDTDGPTYWAVGYKTITPGAFYGNFPGKRGMFMQVWNSDGDVVRDNIKRVFNQR